MNRWLSNKKTFCIITGASRGLGRVLALEFAPRFAKDSTFLLLARNIIALQAVKCELESKVPGIKVIVHSVDLGVKTDAVAIQEIITSALPDGSSNFDQAVILHNAGTVGRSAITENYDDPDEWAKYLALNLISPACLNAAFLKTFPQDAVKQRLVINISSLAAVKPLPSAGMYNTGKAAREALFLTLAVEDPSIKVLNYSPGPLDTDMYRDARKDIVHPKGKVMFEEMIATGRVLSCEATTKKLLSVLEQDVFASGDRIDYYDR